MALELKGIELFTRYDVFSKGLLGAFFSISLWFLLAFAFFRIYSDKPIEKAIEVISPMLLTSFFMSFFGFPPILIGIGSVIALFAGIKAFTTMNWKQYGLLVFQIISLIFIFGNAYEFGLPLFFIYIIYSFVRSQNEINKNKKKKD